MANTNGLPGLTFESALDPNAMSNGVGRYDNEPETRFRRSMREADRNNDFLSAIANWSPSRNQMLESQYEGFLNSNPSENIGLEAASYGFGDSKLDKRMTNVGQLSDLEDARARQQSTLGIYANSIAKMGVLAATTAADSWIGLPAGLINYTIEARRGNINSGRDFINSIISNPVSSYLQSINDKSEEIFANHQTSEERNRSWWENIFTANFIGETLIKNAGFTIGAVLGAKATVNALGGTTQLKEARDAFKGLAAELGLSGKSTSEVVQALASGRFPVEKRAAVKALEESARKLKSAEMGLQIAGGLMAGMGEARIEAINGANEYERSIEEIYGDMDMERATALMQIREDMALNGIDYNTREGRAYYESQKKLVDDRYTALKEEIAHDKAMVANTIFGLNVPLLTFGDVAQWGKVMLGGYSMDRNLVNGIKKSVEKTALKTGAGADDIVRATRYVQKGNKFTDLLGKVGAGSKNVLIEMQEEMNQSLFSATAKTKAMGNTTEFVQRLYDPNATYETVSWLDAAREGMRQSWLNKEDWVEGFAGGFMGFMGLPSISVRVNEKGRRVPKVTMEGGVWTPIREQNELYKRRNELIEQLNNRLSSPEFLNYYYGRIGNRHFDSIKEEAIAKGDKNEYNKADHAQLINDAMMFAKAGRLQDFIDIVDSFSNVTDDTIRQIKSLFSESKEIQDMPDESLREIVRNNSEKMKRRLDNYLKISDDIKTVYGNSIDDMAAAELTWQTAHLDEIEEDLKNVLSDPASTAMLAKYRSENPGTAEGLNDAELLSSDLFYSWLKEKYDDPKDETRKYHLKTAMDNARDAAYDMSERIKYINNLSKLSSDPEYVMKRMAEEKAQIEREMQNYNMAKAVMLLSVTDKLSDFVNAMQDLEDVEDQVLPAIKKEADGGNKVAQEYLKVRDIDSIIENSIRKSSDDDTTENDIQQAKKAWNYFMQNSDTAFDLISDHKASDISPDIASSKAVELLNKAIKEANKELKFFDTIQRRNVSKQKETGGKNEGAVGGESTKFKTTGKKLTEKVFQDIVADLRKHANNISSKGGNASAVAMFHRVDLDKSNLTYNGNPASGYIYYYYKGGNKDIPVAYDYMGNEIDLKDLDNLRGPDNQDFVSWVESDDFPVSAKSYYSVLFDSVTLKNKKYLPIDAKPAGGATSVSGKKESGNNPGSKTNPHKFIAPNMDVALLGGDGHAVAETLKALEDGAEIHFGIESKDGPIYLLAGENNTKIGTLPKEVEGSDYYSGLAELDSLIRKEFEESDGNRNANGIWISEKYVNHIREKRNTGFETIDENIPLSKIPGFEKIKEPVIMFVYDDGDEQKRLFSSPSVKYEDVARQMTRQSSDKLTTGFPYLLVRSGNKYIPVFLYNQNVNSSTLNLRDPEVTSKGFGKRVSDTIDKVVDAVTKKKGNEKVESFQRWALNIGKSGHGKISSSPDSLQRLLYFNSKGRKTVQFYIKETCPQHPEWFDDNVVMVINNRDEKEKTDDYIPIEVGKDKSVRDQIIDALEDLTYETESGKRHVGPYANVSAIHFVEDAKNLQTRIRELVESDMLLANVKDFDLEMPSFIMDYWSASDGKFIRPSHAPAKKKNTAKVVTKNTKSNGKEKIASFDISGTEIQYNLATGEVKIGKGKWFNIQNATDSDAKVVKKLGYKSGVDFMKTAKALAIIADKYGDDENGEFKIGNRVVLKRFVGNSDAGFVITDNGGRFMDKDELVKFKAELKISKADNEQRRKEDERKRIAEEKKEVESPVNPSTDTVDYDSMDQEFDVTVGPRTDEIANMEKVHNVRQAIEHLKKNAPQYAPFLDYISSISYYDNILVEFVNNVDSNNPNVGGRNIVRYRGNEFTDRILIGRNSLGYQTVMHELVHAFTAVALRYDNELVEDIQTSMDFMRDSVGNAKLSDILGMSGMRAFSDPKEFIAEFFSNPKLQELAKGIQMPSTVEEVVPKNIFARIINYIAKAFRKLFKKGDKSFYDNLNDLLYSVVDRQAELQNIGKAVFKTGEEFDQAKKFASGAAVDGVAMSTKIPTVEENYDYRYESDLFGDESLVESPGRFNGPGRYLTISQLVRANDEYSSFSGMKRFINSANLYEYNSGTMSSLLGVRDSGSGVFVAVRALPAGSSDYSALIRTAAASDVPMIIGSDPDNIDFYKAFGFHAVHDSEVDGKIFMANGSFTDEHLYKLGSTYRPFADVLDSNSRFSRLRREAYSDSEWDKFSEIEKYHARKCIGI